MPDQAPDPKEDSPHLRFPQRVAEMIDVLTEELVRKADFDKAKAAELAALVVSALAFHFGGRLFYLPRGDAMRRCARDGRIWAEFTGSNHDELAERFGLGISQIYKIVARQRELLRQRRERTGGKPETPQA